MAIITNRKQINRAVTVTVTHRKNRKEKKQTKEKAVTSNGATEITNTHTTNKNEKGVE
jgi:hypothetical protein